MGTTAGVRRSPRPVQVSIQGHLKDQSLSGDLAIPARPIGLVVFAHGSGSSRLSPRNRSVADVLDQHRLATLLIDLLTPPEEIVDDRTAQLRFDIGLLARRLIEIADWTTDVPDLRELPIGLFGASTGGGAALVAAAERPAAFRAVVSRGGRPDLAGPALARVTAPTLLIVGGADGPVIELNEEAMRQMRNEVRLEIVPRATHLFQEPGALERVAALAAGWFERHLSAPDARRRAGD
jgi:pimeloyl-ACP methyl ester carboxylesterase